MDADPQLDRSSRFRVCSQSVRAGGAAGDVERAAKTPDIISSGWRLWGLWKHCGDTSHDSDI